MSRHVRIRAGALAAALVFTASCGSSEGSGRTAAPSTLSTSTPSATPPAQDIMKLEKFAPLEPGTYFIDPDSDPATPLRVVYQIPARGWSQWFGALKSAGDEHVMINITTVVNVVRDGCRDHAWAEPPVGPSVDDLAAALADLAPFRVTSAPKDVTRYGYRGKHLALAAPDLRFEGDDFIGCVDGNLLSWVAPIDVAEGELGAFHGYSAEPVEEFWILDVDGTRLVIEANWSRSSPAADVAEMQAVLESIRVEP